MTFSELKALKLGTDREWAEFIKEEYRNIDWAQRVARAQQIDAEQEQQRLENEAFYRGQTFEMPLSYEVNPDPDDWFPEEPVELPDYIPPYDDPEPAWVQRLEKKMDILLERSATVHTTYAVSPIPVPVTWNYTP